MKKNGIIKGAMILTIASLMTRILGFVYRVYMSSVMGSEGMGLYQLVFPVYMLAWSISSSGFSTGIAKITASEHAHKQYANSKKVLYISLLLSTCLSLLLSVFLYFFADIIAIQWIKDERTILSLKTLAFSFPCMSAGSCIRGYFYGIQNTKVPAISQVIEQLLRMITIFICMSVLRPETIEKACETAFLGIVIGEIVSFLYMYFAIHTIFQSETQQFASKGFVQLLQMILSLAIPLTANRVCSSILSAYENILIPQKLIEYGMTKQEAISNYGELMGMVLPLIQFPSAFLFSLSIALVPAVSEASTIKDIKKIKRTIDKSFLFAGVVGIGAALLFVVFPAEIGNIIYGKPELKNLLFVIGWVCPLMYLNIVLSGILNGLGEQILLFKNNLLSSAITLLFIYFFTPTFGLYGFLAGWFLAIVVCILFSMHKLYQLTKVRFDFNNWFYKPCLGAFFSGSIILLFKNRLYFVLDHPLYVVLFILMMYIFYFLYLVLSKCILISDIYLIKDHLKKEKK